MMHAKSESDVTSLDSSSPMSPKRRPVYYVQSPSRDSHDDDKSSSMHTTPAYNSSSPLDDYSPSRHSSSAYGRHSMASSASRVSGKFRWGGGDSGRKGSNNNKRNGDDKGWHDRDDVIDEEGNDESYYYGDRGVSRQCRCLVCVLGLGLVFGLFCLVIWGVSRPFKAEISVQSLTVHSFYVGQGSDTTGVPTKMLTVNCSVMMNVYNPATFFGIHVSSSPVNLMYSELAIATGQIEKYYQPRKSHQPVTMNLEGKEVPLYGAGPSLAHSDSNGGVPVMLVFDVRTEGDVVGKLVKSKHVRHVSCSSVIRSRGNQSIKVKEASCRYD